MYDRPFQDAGAGYEAPGAGFQPPYGYWRHHHRGGRGIVRTALMWAAIAVVAMLAFGAVTWVFGVVFGLLALLLKVALVTAVVAFVWRRVTRRRHQNYQV